MHKMGKILEYCLLRYFYPLQARVNIFILIFILWTGAALNAPYSLLLISNKFWMGRGGGKVVCRRGRRVIGGELRWQCGKKTYMPSKIFLPRCHANPPPITLNPGPRNPRVHKTTYAPMISTAPCVMFFDAGRSLTWGSGRGAGTGNLEFSGPQMALAYRLDAISKGSTKLSISSASQPPSHSPSYVSARIKNITHGAVEIIGA